AIDPLNGHITWLPTSARSAIAEFMLTAYDVLGADVDVKFTLIVADDNHAPVLSPLLEQYQGQEGSPLSIPVFATDADGNNLAFWADGLPPGAVFDPILRTLNWTPDFDSSGT